MARLGTGVIARYANWYHGDDDFFTHCLILKNGHCWLLGQGLQQVTLRMFKARPAKLRQLRAALASIPADWATASYSGYNFITGAEQPAASEIAVYGKKPGTTLGGYFVPPPGSVVESLVKTIARIN